MILHKTTSPMEEDNILHQSAFCGNSLDEVKSLFFFSFLSPPPKSVGLFVVPKIMKHTNSSVFLMPWYISQICGVFYKTNKGRVTL
jgi:hypothetical protein